MGETTMEKIFEKELEEIKELLLDTEIQIKGLEELLDDIDSQLNDFEKSMNHFVINVLPRLINYKNL
jgi:hypothetical protein